MKIEPGLYRRILTPEDLRFAGQAGAEHVVAHLAKSFAGHDPKIHDDDAGPITNRRDLFRARVKGPGTAENLLAVP